MSVPSSSCATEKEKPQKEDIISIMVATDCHLGYEENDAVIGEDSFTAFEEILILAVEKDVDMILLGGDLFHHNNPSQQTMNKCMSLLRRYTMGDKPIYIELLSEAADAFSHCAVKTLNYLDENLNVSIPVFSIHGNHDDPSGHGQYSSLDTLSSAGLVNYFGKWTDLSKVEVKPILLKKGKTLLSLYGLSHIKDDRLSRLFVTEKVRPKEYVDDWFNIFVLHQNRADRGSMKFVKESYLPDFLHLVIWGHEHDCRVDYEENEEKGFKVVQPGSSVPTSLCEGEAIEKKVALLRIHKKKFKLTPIKLKTVRPFIWKTIKLTDIPITNPKKKAEEIQQFCLEEVEEMIVEAGTRLTGHPKQPQIPLIRLRCEYEHESEMFNIVKFGQMFLKKVANPNLEIIKLKRVSTRTTDSKDRKLDLQNLEALYQDTREHQTFMECVNYIVKDYFMNQVDKRMMVLSVEGMGLAVQSFLEKDNQSAIEEMVRKQFERTTRHLETLEVDENNVRDEVERYRDEREGKGIKEEVVEGGGEGNQGNQGSGSGTDEYDPEEALTTSMGVGRSQTRGARNGAGGGRAALVVLSDEEMEEEAPPKKGARGRGRGRGKGRGVSDKPASSTRGRGRSPRGKTDTTSRKRQPLNISTTRFQPDSDSE